MLLDGTDSSSDVVYLKNVQLRAVVGPEAWHRPGRQQPVLVSVKMPTSINEAGDLDDVTKTIHYGILSKSITKLFSGKPEFASLRELAERVAHAALIEGNGKDSMHITALLPEALLLADGLGISARFRAAKNKDGSSNLHTEQQTLFVKDLRLNCILGVNPHERIEKQPVIINIEFNRFENTLLTEYATSIKLAAESIESSSFETIEALVTSVAKQLCLECPVESVTISAEKPRALTFIDAAGVKITRSRDFFTK